MRIKGLVVFILLCFVLILAGCGVKAGDRVVESGTLTLQRGIWFPRILLTVPEKRWTAVIMNSSALITVV